MQLTHLTIDQAADVLQNSVCLSTIDWPGANLTHVLEHNGRDILMVVDAHTGDAMVIDGDAHDRDSGGSVHHHARAILSADAVA